MHLIRIKLENWRGVRSSEITLDAGVTIIEGANETGKSSFIEALNLLFNERDSTKKQEIKRVTPKGFDTGSTVEVELKSGAIHLTYRKTFNKKTSTSLLLHAPEVLQLTGAEAHERVQKILDETIDFDLWKAIQLEQGNDFTQVNLKGSDSLAQALDTAAGGTGAGDGETRLLEKVKAEYLRYFTERTGKVTGELAQMRQRVSVLVSSIESTTQKLSAMNSIIERSDYLTKDFRTAQASIPHMQEQLAQHEKVLLRRVTLQEQQKLLTSQLQAQQLKVQGIDSKLTERNRIREQLQKLKDGSKAGLATLTEFDNACQKALQALVATTTGSEDLIKQRALLEAQLRSLESVLQLRDRKRELQTLEVQLSKVKETRTELDSVNSNIASLLVDDAMLEKLQALAQQQREIDAKLSAQSPAMKVVALQNNVPLTIDGELRTLGQKDQLSPDTTKKLQLQVSDLVTVELIPAADLDALQGELQTAHNSINGLLQQCGVATIDNAVAVQRERATLLLQKNSLEQRIVELLDGHSADALHHRVHEHQQKVGLLEKQLAEDGAAEKPIEKVNHDVGGLEHQQQKLRNQVADADLALQDARRARDAAQEAKATADTRLQLFQQQQLSDDSAIETLERQLEAGRAEVPDKALQSEAEQERQLLLAYKESSVQRQREAESQPMEDAKNLVANARGVLERATADLHEIEKERVEIRAKLDVLQAEGLHEKRELLLAEHDDATAGMQRLESAAMAAHTLWTKLGEHQRRAQLSYARPLAERVAQMGRLVFGKDFAVQLSPSLTIESRTLNGLTVPFDDLSGGAREQLGIMLRLAAAQLVSEDEGMPLILDDTLGHTDARRLETMGAILSNAGRKSQIVVLTCYPRRYGYVGEARVVKLAEHQQGMQTELPLSI